jgi:hypothetical protein
MECTLDPLGRAAIDDSRVRGGMGVTRRCIDATQVLVRSPCMREPALPYCAGCYRASAPSLILRFAPMLGLCGFSFNYLARSRILSGIELTPLWDH